MASNDRIFLDQVISRRNRELAPHLKPDEYFEIFVAEELLKDYNDLSYEELFAGNPGGSGDGGIDGMHIFVNGVWVDEGNLGDLLSLRQDVKIDLFIIQAKNKPKFEEVVIDKFNSISNEIFDFNSNIEDLRDYYNQDLLQIADRFRNIYSALSSTFPKTTINYVYASKGDSPTDNMKRKADNLCSRIRELIRGVHVSFVFLGAAELLDLSRRQAHVTYSLRIAEGPILSRDSDCFIGLVKLTDYFAFITDPDSGDLVSRLFEANVRDWQGDNKVNKQIYATLEKNLKEDFWWFNNGVTILATTANISGGQTLQMMNPEIVNGLQTSRSIYQYFSQPNINREDTRKLLVRVIVVSGEKTSREQIIRATNSQTPVPDEALRSLDNVHRNIEMYFESQSPPLYYDRRKNYYKNQRKPAHQIIGIKKLAQAVLATTLFRPDDARGRPSDYLRTGDDEQYLAVFNEKYPPPMYYFCARFIIEVDNILRGDFIDSKYDSLRRSTLFHIMTHVILRHTGLDRNVEPPPVHEIAKQSIESIDKDLVIDSANIVLDQLYQQRKSDLPFQWRNFEKSFFVELDKTMGRG